MDGLFLLPVFLSSAFQGISALRNDVFFQTTLKNVRCTAIDETIKNDR